MDAPPLIAIFCTSFPPERGAAAQRMHHIALLLRDAGYRVEVVSSLPNYPTGRISPGYRGRLQRHDTVDGIPVQRCWLYPSNSGAALPRAVNMLSQMVSFRVLAFQRIVTLTPALAIVSSPPLLMAAAAVQYFRRAGIPVLLNVSDLWPLSAKALGAASESWMYRLMLGRERRMYDEASAISGQSQAILDHVYQRLGVPKPVFLLRNLPKEPVRHRSIREYDPAQPLRIIYPGLLGHAQGLHTLIAAVDWRSLNAELLIYGEGAEQDSIERWILEHPDQPVRLQPPVSPDELQRRFEHQDTMLIPLISEIPGAVPSKLFTAMQAGLPVLYNAGGEGAAIVRKYGLGFVSSPGNYAGLAQSIRSMQQLGNEGRIKFRDALLHAAMHDFDREAQNKRFLAFVSELI